MTTIANYSISKNEKVIADYLIEQERGIFRCTIKLKKVFTELLPLISGSSNPLHISTVIHEKLPSELIQFLQGQVFISGNPGFFILLDLPHQCSLENSFSVALTAIVSFPICYPGEGGLSISIKPKRKSASKPSFSNASEFQPHTDLSYVTTMPDVLTMVVKKAAKSGGESLIACGEDTLRLLSHEVYHQLSLAQFIFLPPSHYKSEYRNEPVAHPVISLKENAIKFRWRQDTIQSSTLDGAEAIKAFAKLLEINTRKIHLPTNSGIVLNQRYILHGREPFAATYDAKDRELTRVYGTVSIANYKAIDYESGIVTL